MNQTIEEKFLARTSPEPTTGCWLWTGQVDADGYGMFYAGERKRVKAHRAAWTLYRGAIPAGLFVCHRCDVRNCVNPDHLFLGTQVENMADMKRKGRGTGKGHRPAAKLSIEQVREIKVLLRDGGLSQYDIARRFHVGRCAITSIQGGKSWREVLPADETPSGDVAGPSAEPTTVTPPAANTDD